MTGSTKIETVVAVGQLLGTFGGEPFVIQGGEEYPSDHPLVAAFPNHFVPVTEEGASD